MIYFFVFGKSNAVKNFITYQLGSLPNFLFKKKKKQTREREKKRKKRKSFRNIEYAIEIFRFRYLLVIEITSYI